MDQLLRTDDHLTCSAALWRIALKAAEDAALYGGADRGKLLAFAGLFVDSMLRQAGGGRSKSAPKPAPKPAVSGPMPAIVRRAEAYLRQHADEPIILADVATALGCSPRALQLVFRRFRGTTPAAALRGLRLERVREEMVRTDQPVAAIALRFRFTNIGRFNAAYAKHFGESPAETRRNCLPLS